MGEDPGLNRCKSSIPSSKSEVSILSSSTKNVDLLSITSFIVTNDFHLQMYEISLKHAII